MNKYINADEQEHIMLENKMIETNEWIYNRKYDVFKCSQCGGFMVRNVYPYCPWCGSNMRCEKNN